MDILRIVGVIHDGNLDRNALFLCLEIDDVVEEMCAMAIYVAHELLQSILRMENLLLGLSFLVWAKIGECNLDACIQERQLSHTASDDVPLIDRMGEDGWVWPELLACTTLVGLADNLYRVERFSLLIFLLIDFTTTEYL